MINRRNIGSRLENWARMYHRMRNDDLAGDRRAFDPADAMLLEEAMPGLPTLQRSLLWWCYVKQDTPADAGLTLGMSTRPALQLFDAFRVAQETIQALVDRESLPQQG